MRRYLSAQVGVKGALFRDGRLLLLQRRDDLRFAPGLWDLPGGGVEVGAGLEGTLVREFREETGFNVRVGRILHAGIARSRSTSGTSLLSVIVYYACSTRARGAPQLDSEEHTRFAWVSRGSLAKFRLDPVQSVAIRKAFRL